MLTLGVALGVVVGVLMLSIVIAYMRRFGLPLSYCTITPVDLLTSSSVCLLFKIFLYKRLYLLQADKNQSNIGELIF